MDGASKLNYKNHHSKFLKIGFFLCVCWIFVIGCLLWWAIINQKQSIYKFAAVEARASFHKDLVYRRWSAIHGGTYVPSTNETPPNPYLSHVAERDILTPSGKALTLVNPAYMTRQVHDLGQNKYGLIGHITSLNPIRPENRPDKWETDALIAFEKGKNEITSVRLIDGVKYLRLMRPMITKKECLKCHAKQGYKEGDLRGGISVAVPLSSYETIANKNILNLTVTYVIIIVLGIISLIITFVVLNKRDYRQKKIEQSLQESEEQHRSIIQTAMDGFFLADTKGRLLEVNETYCKMSGYSDKELLSMRISQLESIETGHEVENRIQTIISRGEDRFESQHFRKDGTTFEVEVSVQYRSIDGGQFVSFIRDITKQKKMETLVHQSQKVESIGTLAGGIAHDFNNILFPIIGNSEMLIEDVPEDSPFKYGLNQIYTGALRASELVKQILTFSRQETGELKLMKLQPIIKEALKLIRATIPTTIAIKQNIQPDCGAIKADPTQIHQIIMNLATNAYHAMEVIGGEMNVRLKKVKIEEPDLFNPDIKPGTFACLSISDTGKGMDNELIEKIFDPFFTTKETGKGTGMGLSVVHGIVKSMHGTIQIYSEPDKGTDFHVYLPLAEDIKEQQVTHAKTFIQGGSEHILLVDDEKAIVELEQNVLERLGYKVTSRSSSIEALEAFRAAPEKFDMVITDMAMPNMSGDKLSVELNKILPGIPVLLCTGFSETMSEEKAAYLGIKGFLLKPIVMRDLSHKIREVLDKHKA
jgi:PAS domain S-box-containing protein